MSLDFTELSGATATAPDPTGLHRVLAPRGVLPQAADVLDASAAIGPDEVRVDVERLNLDAASFRQLREAHRTAAGSTDVEALRAAVLDIVEARGKMQNPVTGSGGMLIGTVAEVGRSSPLGLEVGQRIATLVSLTLTPLRITDGLHRWDGRGEQVPASGHAILFGRSIAAPLPDDLPEELSLAVLDVCGAPALVRRVLGQSPGGCLVVIGGGGKSGSLSLAAGRDLADRRIGVVPTQEEADRLARTGLADEVVVADARNPVALRDAVTAAGGPGDVTVVCVDVPGCEHGAVLSTAEGGTVIFFSMATDFAAAALGAEGLAADITMLIGNGFVPGHAQLALDLVRAEPDLRTLIEAR
ncbi:L-erythro-3,5-diaminohexanoate dehydrogenase [Nocardioides sambongensis]|uniref:L-erythro-3,5-diaminohexanoate dehydrogenase n=1 Tax=Nocardioides sambongensis TaxID=2589074 RepID=UPI001E46B138|nr:L-erythro-3,5-diaminohexanoate dehydrogenase [Nocardioides sambongensis]